MQEGYNLMGEVFFSLCKTVDSPRSLGKWLRFKHGCEDVIESNCDPKDYEEYAVDSFRKDYLIDSFLSKWKGFDFGIDLEAVAIRKFNISEERCKTVNLRLLAARSECIDPVLSSRIARMRWHIGKLLGGFSLAKIRPYYDWGPGATFDVSRSRAFVDTKMLTIPITVSASCRELLAKEIEADLHWSAALLGCYPSGPYSLVKETFETIECCRMTTVPKSAKTDRTIAIEPTGSLFLQKGVGGFIRRRLRSVGIDLDDQETNQKLAGVNPCFGLATLDLKSASDSVSRELVFELLPVDWAVWMDRLRSKKVLKPDGEVAQLEKFSSMGNGFTFELESLIFWAAVKVTQEDMDPTGVFSVYGDDIICTDTAAPELVRTLDFLGFEVNDEKSFVSGPFRESCGKHFFGGQDVTPKYQKETCEDLRELIRLHNRLVRWSQAHGVQLHAQEAVYRAAPLWLRRCVLPYGVEGDDGFLRELCEIFELMLPPPDIRKRRRRRVKGLTRHAIRLRYVRSEVRTLPGMELALLAHSLRRSCLSIETVDPLEHLDARLEGPRSLKGGDVFVPEVSRRVPAPVRVGWRWVVPPGVCLLT